jgi:hypothetical protein
MSTKNRRDQATRGVSSFRNRAFVSRADPTLIRTARSEAIKSRGLLICVYMPSRGWPIRQIVTSASSGGSGLTGIPRAYGRFNAARRIDLHTPHERTGDRPAARGGNTPTPVAARVTCSPALVAGGGMAWLRQDSKTFEPSAETRTRKAPLSDITRPARHATAYRMPTVARRVVRCR